MGWDDSPISHSKLSLNLHSAPTWQTRDSCCITLAKKALCLAANSGSLSLDDLLGATVFVEEVSLTAVVAGEEELGAAAAAVLVIGMDTAVLLAAATLFCLEEMEK